jgi:hypothetical protein
MGFLTELNALLFLFTTITDQEEKKREKLIHGNLTKINTTRTKLTRTSAHTWQNRIMRG